MSISKTRHDRTRTDGKPVFIVRTPNPLTRKFMGVDFVNGIGKTQYELRARVFDEQFGYEVQLPKGYKAWLNAQGNRIEHAVEIGREDDEGDDEEELNSDE